MYSSTFIFNKKQFDQDFYRLDDEIASYAKKINGYLGEESWENPSTGEVCNVYYWESLDALQELVNHPAHLKAKARYETWLSGYRVVISQVLKSYGTGMPISVFNASKPDII